MSTQRGVGGGSTECFENWVLVLVGLGYKMFRKLGTLLHVVSEVRCPRDGHQVVVTADVSLLNDFSVALCSELSVSDDYHQMVC
jgi:hypothetical protein